MAHVAMSIEEHQQIVDKLSSIETLKNKIHSFEIFEDSAACFNTENDIIRALTLEETKALVKAILEL